MPDTYSIQKAEFIAGLIDDNFLKLARELSKLKQDKPDQFLQIAEMAGINSRTCYAMIRIVRKFDKFKIPDERLSAIGWTKLQIAARHFTDNNIEQLLQIAEENTAYNLERIMRGEEPIQKGRVIQFYLNTTDYQLLRKTLLAHGALPAGIGLTDMGPALMAFVKAHSS